MPTYRVIDPATNAGCGTFIAWSELAALNAAARLMGWDDYRDYLAGAAAADTLKTSGRRLLKAVLVAGEGTGLDAIEDEAA